MLQDHYRLNISCLPGCFAYLTLAGLNLPLSSHTLQAANCCRNSRLAVDEDDLTGVTN